MKFILLFMTKETFYELLACCIIASIAFQLIGCGTKGEKGDTGSQSPVLIAPATPQQCPTGGSVVTLGGQSALLCNGAIGPQGTSVEVVQLCPGTSSYPSTFPEAAICIDNELYAVYSSKGGFLTMLPPGTYHSDAVGSICTFTVQPGCLVFH